MKLLFLHTDSYGATGGIAKFNRDLMEAFSTIDECERVLAVPRILGPSQGEIPNKIQIFQCAARSKLHFVFTLCLELARTRAPSHVVCGHIHLLPVALLASRFLRKPLVLVIHGVEAWTPTTRPVVNWCARRVDQVISVSSVTARRFLTWTHLSEDRVHILPNCVDIESFRPGPKNESIVKRHDLGGKIVLLTLGRLTEIERFKGFDVVLDLLPKLVHLDPRVVYVICGDGTERRRLEDKAQSLGISGHVRFTGFVSEADKKDYYRCADVFVMPSKGEGFGIVLLEAMACGVPVVGSLVDGSREALRDGELGLLVDPDDSEAVIAAIFAALRKPRLIPAGLEYFSKKHFNERVKHVVDGLACQRIGGIL